MSMLIEVQLMPKTLPKTCGPSSNNNLSFANASFANATFENDGSKCYRSVRHVCPYNAPFAKSFVDTCCTLSASDDNSSLITDICVNLKSHTSKQT